MSNVAELLLLITVALIIQHPFETTRPVSKPPRFLLLWHYAFLVVLLFAGIAMVGVQSADLVYYYQHPSPPSVSDAVQYTGEESYLLVPVIAAVEGLYVAITLDFLISSILYLVRAKTMHSSSVNSITPYEIVH
jgi:hypothetical protein